MTGEHIEAGAFADQAGIPRDPAPPWTPQETATGVLPILGRAALAALLAYVVINFVLIPDNRIIGFPIQHDDFTNLSHTSIDLYRARIRPVSTMTLMALSMAGPTSFFVVLHVLTVAHVALALTFLAVLFRVRRPPLAFLFALSVPPFAFEYIVYYYRYTGLITNLLSISLGALSLLLLLTGLRGPQVLRVRVVLGVVSFALSLLSKEDFILPVVLLCAYLALPGVATSRRQQVTRLTLTAGLGAAAAAWLLFSTVVVRSPFLGMARGPYERVFAPASLFATVIWYLRATASAKIATALQAFGLLASFFPDLRRHWRELLLAQFIPLALVFAYAPLPHHTNPYYCFNWLPWQLGCLMVFGHVITLLPRRSTRLATLVALLALAAVPVAITQGRRQEVAQQYRTGISVSRNIIDTLLANRLAITGVPLVAILDPPAHNPWFGTDGSFLANRYGLRTHWLVLVPRDGEYYRSVLRLRGRLRWGSVETADVSELARLPHVPVIRFAPDGHGTFTWSASEGTGYPVEPSLWAEPNPIEVCDGTGLGVADISWIVPKGTVVEVRVGSPLGTVCGQSTGTWGTATTGKWVGDGTEFVLLDTHTHTTLATLTVHVTSAGCP